MNTETQTKSNLTQAFERVQKLNLGISLKQSLDLSNILYDLANKQFNKGLNTANEIHKKYDNL